jgi:hypothetical protein
MREIYDFYIEAESESYLEFPLLAHFHLGNEKNDKMEELALACDETGKVILLLGITYDIKIWADIDYVPQKIDPQYDPFCGQH